MCRCSCCHISQTCVLYTTIFLCFQSYYLLTVLQTGVCGQCGLFAVWSFLLLASKNSLFSCLLSHHWRKLLTSVDLIRSAQVYGTFLSGPRSEKFGRIRKERFCLISKYKNIPDMLTCRKVILATCIWLVLHSCHQYTNNDINYLMP